MKESLIHQLKGFFHNQLIYLIGEECSKELIVRNNFKNLGCIKLFISKCLSLAIVLGGLLVKIPQIVKILYSTSVAGLSLFSYLLESLAYSIGIAYNIRMNAPFMTYGEGAFMLVQNLTIISLMLIIGRRPVALFAFYLFYGVAHGSLYFDQIVSGTNLQKLQMFCIPFMLFSKLPQIVGMLRRKNPGQMSSITVFMLFAGNIARIFTTVQEVGDRVLLLGYSVAALLNGVILTLCLYYSSPKKVKRLISPITKQPQARFPSQSKKQK